MSGKGVFFLVMAILCLVSLIAWGVVRIVASTNFDFGCENYLKRASDANTVELAKPELKKAIDYLESHNLTSGTVSIFLQNPKNDIGYFYNNLKASYAELEAVKSDASQLETSNVLMKLRETILDDGEETTVTHPAGISIYPNNALFFWWSIFSLVGIIVFVVFAYRAEY